MQLSYNANPGHAFSGMIADIGIKDVISRIASAKQLFSVAVTTEYNAQIFTVTIDGTAYAYTGDSNATKAEIAAGLKALIDAGNDNVTTTLFTTSETDDSFYLENNSFEDALVVTITNPANGVLTLTELVPHEVSIPFGVCVCVDDRQTVDSNTGKHDQCRLPRLAVDVTTLGFLLGAVVADTSKVTLASSPYGGYAAGEAVPILKKGRIWMHVEDVASVTVGGLVYVRRIAGATEQLGDIRAADDGSDTDVLPFASAHFTGETVGSGTTGIAVVEWNL